MKSRIYKTCRHDGTRKVNGRAHGSKWKDILAVEVWFEDPQEAKDWLDKNGIPWDEHDFHGFDDNDYGLPWTRRWT